MEEEIWKHIVDNPMYLASNLGNIKNGKTGHIFIPYRPASRKYPMVTIQVPFTKSGKKSYFVHQLVAQAFYGSANGREVDHIDGNHENNRADNLEYVTGEENIRREILNNLGGKFEGRYPIKASELSDQVKVYKYSKMKGSKQGRLVKEYNSFNELSQDIYDFGLSNDVVSRIKNNLKRQLLNGKHASYGLYFVCPEADKIIDSYAK